MTKLINLYRAHLRLEIFACAEVLETYNTVLNCYISRCSIIKDGLKL